MAHTGTTASYEANPGEDTDGVPVCRKECGAYGDRAEPYTPPVFVYNDGRELQAPPAEPFCCITKRSTYQGEQCKPVLLARLRVAKAESSVPSSGDQLPNRDADLEETRYASLDAMADMRRVVSGLRGLGYHARAVTLDRVREEWARECRAPLGERGGDGS